jgi:hypothetical protein
LRPICDVRCLHKVVVGWRKRDARGVGYPDPRLREAPAALKSVTERPLLCSLKRRVLTEAVGLERSHWLSPTRLTLIGTGIRLPATFAAIWRTSRWRKGYRARAVYPGI